MTKLQISIVSSAVLFFLVLYIGCDTVPRKIQALEKSRALSTESTNLEVLLMEARPALTPADLGSVLALEQQIAQIQDDSARVRLLKEISGLWFSLGFRAMSGAYAEQAAEITAEVESWSIAGTTFTICVQRSEEEKVRAYCTDHAVNAYENAISLDPLTPSHKVNLSLLYVENPPEDNPMKGITMLLELNKEYPESVLVLNALGRLAIRTGQFDRARERLEKDHGLEPDNADPFCLLAQVFEGLGDVQNAGRYEQLCRTLTKKNNERIN